MRFKDKVVIVTGASRGIGKAIALLFAKEGAKVVVDYHVSEDYEPDAKENADGVVSSIKDLGSDAIAIACDVSDETQVQDLIKKTLDTYGQIDILINNAGIVFDVPYTQKSADEFKRTINTNLLGTFLCTKYAAKAMAKGKIVNTSSTSGTKCFNPESIDYDSSKVGIIAMTRNFAKALAPNIQVNSVAPGWVNTEMNKDLPQDFIDEETAKLYAGRFTEPEEIAKVVLFLASKDADYITGTTLEVDGGSD